MGNIILFINMKGGVGKSTLTYLTAISLSSSSKVAVLDFDIQQGSLSQLKDLVTDFDIIPHENIESITDLDYDFILIDTSPFLSNRLPELIGLADLIVIPSKAGYLDILAIQSTINLVEKYNKKDKAMIVLNMIKANTKLTFDILISLKEYEVSIANTFLSDLVSITRSVLVKGVGNDKNAQQQIESLTKEILMKLVSL